MELEPELSKLTATPDERTAGRRGATLEIEVEEEELGEGATSSLFQVVREALDQAIRRAKVASTPGLSSLAAFTSAWPATFLPLLSVSAVRVSLTRTSAGGVRLEISDDAGPERRQAVIDGLAERAAELNGTFDATRDGRWTTIRIVLPPSAARL